MHHFDAVVVCCTFCTLLVLLFGHLFEVFRSVSLDLTGDVYTYGPLEASKFVEKQVMLPATL